MNRKIIILIMVLVLPMLLIPVGSALDVPVTSYWGYVTENGIPTSGAVVTVHDAAGNEITTTTSLGGSDMGLYQVNVNWDDLTTTDVDEGVIGGETITFKINGKTVNSRVIAELGSNNRLDLDVTTTSDDTWTPAPATTSENTSIVVQNNTETPGDNPTPVLISAETPEEDSTQVQSDTETPEETPTATPVSTPLGKKTPGFGVITAVFALMCLAIRMK